MKQTIPAAAGIAIAIIIGVLVLYFGWRKVSGGPDADVTQETINRYQNMVNQSAKQGSGGDSKQMTHGVAPANAPANNTGNSQ